jgi:hypothetical protein
MSSPAHDPPAVPMTWMNAYEYFVIEQIAHDRLDEARRFSLERAFHSEPAEDTAAPHGAPARRACGSLWPDPASCAQHA